jgi:hypothetical protein
MAHSVQDQSAVPYAPYPQDLYALYTQDPYAPYAQYPYAPYTQDPYASYAQYQYAQNVNVNVDNPYYVKNLLDSRSSERPYNYRSARRDRPMERQERHTSRRDRSSERQYNNRSARRDRPMERQERQYNNRSARRDRPMERQERHTSRRDRPMERQDNNRSSRRDRSLERPLENDISRVAPIIPISPSDSALTLTSITKEEWVKNKKKYLIFNISHVF